MRFPSAWIRLALGVLLLLAWAGCGPSAPAPKGQLTQQAAQVVVGGGNVDAAVLAKVEQLVATGLASLRNALPVREVGKFTVFVHARKTAMPDPLAAMLHEDSPAFTLLGARQVHLVWGEMVRLGSSPRAVVTHELVHELLDQLCGAHGAKIPRWFHEGLAQQLAGDTYLGAKEEDLVWRAAVDRLLSFSELARQFPHDREAVRTAYAQSYSYVSFLVREYGLERLVAVATAVDGRTSFERALVGMARRSTYDLQQDWRNYLLRASGAPWRVLLSEWWGLLGIALLPVLVLALRRRLAAGQRAAQRLEATQQQATALAEHIAAVESAQTAQVQDRDAAANG